MTDQTPPTAPPDTARLTDDDRAAVRHVLNQMPYLPIIPTAGFRMSPDTVADLVTLLADFAEVLHRVGDENNGLEERYSRLRLDVATVRRVLGTAPAD